MNTVSKHRQPDELVQARRLGFMMVKNNRRGIDLVNQWWRECRSTRRPYLTITVRGSKTVDLRLENATMNGPHPEPVSCFTVEERSQLLALVAPAATWKGGMRWADQYACEAIGMCREGVETLAAYMLAVVLGKCWCSGGDGEARC